MRGWITGDSVTWCATKAGAPGDYGRTSGTPGTARACDRSPRRPVRVAPWPAGGPSDRVGHRVPGHWGRDGGRLGVPGRPDDGGRDEFPECCPTRASRSRTRSTNRTFATLSSRMVTCCPAFVARSSTTRACSVATTYGITHQNAEGLPYGTLPRHDRLNGYTQGAVPGTGKAHGTSGDPVRLVDPLWMAHHSVRVAKGRACLEAFGSRPGGP